MDEAKGEQVLPSGPMSERPSVFTGSLQPVGRPRDYTPTTKVLARGIIPRSKRPSVLRSVLRPLDEVRASTGSAGIPKAEKGRKFSKMPQTVHGDRKMTLPSEGPSSNELSPTPPGKEGVLASVFAYIFQRDGVKYFLLWLLWMTLGTIFYAINNELGAAKGFFMAVNIGYSIGFGTPSEDATTEGISEGQALASRIFSTLYVIVGASFVGLALGYFGDKLVEDRDNWYQNAEQYEAYCNSQADGRNIAMRIISAIQFRWLNFRLVLAWCAWTAMGAIASIVAFDWPFNEAVYFAVSSCSTGGHWAIPDDSSNLEYFVAGLFAAIGVPTMGAAMASLASLFVSTGDLSAARKAIWEPVTVEEIQMMERFGLADENEIIDRVEFMVLCLVRTGVDPGLVGLIGERFDELDYDKSGDLSMAEILDTSQLDEYKRWQAQVLSERSLQSTAEHYHITVEMAPSKAK